MCQKELNPETSDVCLIFSFQSVFGSFSALNGGHVKNKGTSISTFNL